MVHEGLTYAEIVSGTVYVQEPLSDGLFSYDYQTNLVSFISKSAATQYGGLYSEVEIQIVTSSGKKVSLIQPIVILQEAPLVLTEQELTAGL